MLLLNNKYQFDPKTDLLGEGGFSRVFKARDILLDRFVALKIANRNDMHSSYNYLDEVRKAIDFNHINVARYYDGFEYSEISFGEKVTYQVGVMEYLPEGILTHEIFRKLSLKEKKQMIAGILKGLRYLHDEQNIIHRDIKPSNILLSRIKGELIPKIADFGISKARGDKSAGVSRIVGSFDFMAPEQFDKKKHIDFNTDLWAFGVLLYQLYLGKMPFSDESSTSEAEVIRNIVEKPVPEEVKRIPSPFREMISKCLVKDRHERISTASDLLEFLEAYNISSLQTEINHFAGETRVLDEPEVKAKIVVPPPSGKEKKIVSPGLSRMSKRLISRAVFIALGVISTIIVVMVIRSLVERQKTARTEKEKQIAGLLIKADGCIDKNLLKKSAGQNAYDYLQEILTLDPENEEAKMRLGKIAVKFATDGDKAQGLGKYTDALNYYTDALVFLPGDSSIINKQAKAQEMINKAGLRAEQGQIPERAASPRDAETKSLQFIRQGDSLVQLKNYSGAIYCYKQALTFKPGDPVISSKIMETETMKNAATGIQTATTETDYLQQYYMVFIQGGTFEMGNKSDDGDDDEKPVHTVKVDGFYLSRYEVTVGQFKEFIEATGYRTDAEKDGSGYFLTNEGFERKPGMNWRYNAKGVVRPSSENNHPVIFVSWNDAAEFCKWLNQKSGKSFRLPTEGEWEFAARGGRNKNQYKFSGSENPGQVSWFNENSDSGTHPVGKKSANSLGLFDLSGNVWEWCSDFYEPYSGEPQTNPIGAKTGRTHVARGGGWFDGDYGCRVTNRGSYAPGYKDFNTGFRLVCK